MRQEFYAIFYGKTHNKSISVLLSEVAYLFFIIKYILKRIFTKNNIVSCDNPEEIINAVYSKPNYPIDIQNKPVNPNIDISIIMPIYNYKDIIESCIESVLAQKTKYKFELILVDDGSTDGAAKIVDKYTELDNVLVVHQKNTGIGGARNTGLNNAQGKYIMFVDCDDYVHDNYVETLLDEAYRTNNDIVLCTYSLVKKAKGEVLSKRDIVYSQKNLMNYKDSEDLIMNYQGLPWNKIYKRKLFEKVRYIKGFWYEDTITHFLIFPQCKSFSYVDESLYDYMWYENNFSHTQTKIVPKSLERYWMLEVMAEEYHRIGLKIDRGFYKILLRHLGKTFYSGIHGFNKEIEDAAFVMGCELLKKYKPNEKYHLTYMEKQLEKALLSQNISKWQLVCTSL